MERRWSAAHQKSGPTERTGQELPAPDSPLRVIIADDDPLACTLVRAMLAGEESLELVGEAHDAEEALALALKAQPDVAILDWRMPKGGGARAARDMTDRCPEVALVALTSSDTEEAAIDMIRAGARSFLVKGGSQEELVRTLHRAVAA